ncbi:putative Galactose oxidase/kelch repeat superfamily protein [Hibiscus syriacus]|uniref:Galactose oxidase/kelch repeat superfamily protein n=1 Tax=Hibiscus syriacus TaxID=106335 RepID=A0A6A2Y1H2_HIBSY|nr:F-box/kelch-repeat protein At1g80440-like [Hibiscus syriacus]KAE8674095.1 putative Galactose oxidase/kelch repeat superfamily protein [Hibiscus syriacus]
MELIPNLPNDVALECLVRVKYDQIAALLSTCKGWKTQIEQPEFFQLRKATSHGQKLVVMAQARVDPDVKHAHQKGCSVKPVFGLSVLEPDTGNWVDFPVLPGEFHNGLPYFCHLVAVGYDLVLIGGLDPVTWEATASVFVFNFLTAKWRRGADMPGVRRSMFGCASGDGTMVYVAGGHDEEKNALKSALAYDLVKDEWIPLPDMATARDEVKGIFRRGKFHAVGGYGTDTQGQFERTVEVFDVATWRWDHVQEDFLEASTCPSTCVSGNDVDVYMVYEGDVVACKDAKWQVLAKLPGDVCKNSYVARWHDKLMVVGSSKLDDPQNAYVLNLLTYDWTKLSIPHEYSGHVHTGCYLEI